MATAMEKMKALGALPAILQAAQVLERYGLLNGENAAAVVRRYVEAHPEINEALNGSG